MTIKMSMAHNEGRTYWKLNYVMNKKSLMRWSFYLNFKSYSIWLSVVFLTSAVKQVHRENKMFGLLVYFAITQCISLSCMDGNYVVLLLKKFKMFDWFLWETIVGSLRIPKLVASLPLMQSSTFLDIICKNVNLSEGTVQVICLVKK